MTRAWTRLAAFALPSAACAINPGGECLAQATAPTTRPARYVPYDGEGRYTMGREAEPETLGIQGLHAMARRWGQKPYEKLWDGTAWQTERAIFRDVTTGAEIWRLTHDLGCDAVNYHKGSWSADGGHVVWRRRPGMWESSTATHGPTVMRSDGTGLRPIAREFRMVRKIQCSRTDPDLVYIMVGDKALHAFDLRTGKSVQKLGDFGGSWHLKHSIDGRYLYSYCKDAAGRRRVWIVSTDGAERYDVSLAKPTHDSYYIHPTLKYLMFWYEGDYRTEGFRMKRFDNRDELVTGVLFDWNHGDFGLAPLGGTHISGRLFATAAGGRQWLPPVNAFAADKDAAYYDRPVSPRNGYCTWRPKDQPWAFGSALVLRPWLSELFMYDVRPVDNDVTNRFRVCLIGNRSNGSLDACDGSPDGTKVIFNSDMLPAPQIYVVVVRRPQPPTDLTARRAADGSVTLSWKPAHYSRETAGYNVYRSEHSGRGYEQVNDALVTGTRFVDRPAGERTVFYVVASVEHSTLEGASPPRPLRAVPAAASHRG